MPDSGVRLNRCGEIMEYKHKSVLLEECMENLSLKDGGDYFDGTLGGGGHSLEIMKRTSRSKLLAIDKDCDALMSAGERLRDYLGRIYFIHDDYKNAAKHIDKYFPEGLDGALLDLGVSSYQIDNPERGFSYMNDAPLDMRMNTQQYLTAFNVVNEYSEPELAQIFYEYGEERFANRIARNIAKIREEKSIRTTGQLAKIIEDSIPAAVRWKNGNPCKKVFQAIRIEVNEELKGLDKAVIDIARRLKKGGRMCVITFHSLEDRLVKNAFKYLEADCICDKKAPICTCNKRKEVNIITRKPITASGEELELNFRAASAKLRVLEKI